jgi:hypothetical protein
MQKTQMTQICVTGLQMNETHILIRLLRMYIPLNWEFGSALSKLQHFRGGEGLTPQNPPLYATEQQGEYMKKQVKRAVVQQSAWNIQDILD